MQSKMDNIKVYIRVRPLTDAERNDGINKMIQIPSKNQLIVYKTDEDVAQGFTFHQVFTEDSTQSDIFASIQLPITENILNGYNCTVFAYGSIGSGKSYTMIGDPDIPCNPMANLLSDDTSIGLIPRTINNLFHTLNRSKAEFSIRISYLEIFNEELFDLLAPNNNNTSAFPLKIFENSKGQVLVNGLTEMVVRNPAAACAKLYHGQEKLKNSLNSHSTRSHTIFTIMVYIKEKPRRNLDDEELLKFAKLNLVELAGNENASNNANKSIRYKINQSLVSFNRVVQALIGKSVHIPYRDSKLTRILQESLGGNSKTSVIATISPGENALEETMNTLEYVTRAKNIQNKPRINERMSKTVLLKDITDQITQLKLDIWANRTKTGQYLTDELYSDMQNQLNTSKQCVKVKKTEIELLNEEYANVEELFGDINSNLFMHNQKIEKLRNAITEMRRQANAYKQNREEKAAKIDRVVQTERILTEQAMQVKQIAEMASVDANQLHSNIERRSAIDREIDSACSTFTVDMKQHLDGMAQFVELNTIIIEKMIDSYTVNYDKSHKMVSGILQQFKSNAELLLKNTDHFKRSTMLNKTVQMAANVHDTINQNHTAVRHLTDIPFKKFLQLYEGQEKNFSNARNNIEKLILLRIQKTKEFITAMETKKKLFTEQLIHTLSSCHMTIDETTGSNKKIKEKMFTIYSQMMDVLEKTKKNNTKLLTLAKPSLSSIKENVQNSMDEIVKSISAHSCELEERKESVKPHLILEYKNSISVIQDELRKELPIEVDLVKNLKIIKTAVVAKSELKLDALSTDLEDQCNILSKNNVAEIVNNFDKHSETVSKQNRDSNDLAGHLTLRQQQYGAASVQSIDRCINDLKIFSERDFLQYSPTGATPKKRDYNTNIVLAATTPHEQIKQKFREHLEAGIEFDCSILD